MHTRDSATDEHSEQIKMLQSEADEFLFRIIMKQAARRRFKDRFGIFLKTRFLDASPGKTITNRLKNAAAAILFKLLRALNILGNTDNSEPAADLGSFFARHLKIYNLKIKTMREAERKRDIAKKAAAIDTFLQYFDFGEINEAVEESTEYVSLLVKTVSDTVIRYHLGKIAALSPSIIGLLNIMMDSVNTILKNKEDLPPDFVADFLVGLFHLIDFKAIGEFLNHKNELIRIIQVGNLLQGDGKTSAFQAATSEKLHEMLSEIDPITFHKMKIGLAGIREAVHSGMIDNFRKHPELIQQIISTKPHKYNAKFKLNRKKLQILSDLSPDQLNSSTITFLENINTYEISEGINVIISLVNTIYEVNEGDIRNFFSEIIDGIDMDECKKASENVVKEFITSLSPLLSILPRIGNERNSEFGGMDSVDFAGDESSHAG